MKKILFLTAIAFALFTFDAQAQCTRGNCFNGNGTFKFDNGDVYDGSFRDGQPNSSKGKYEFANGDFYEGSFVNGKREGSGKYVWKNGGVYIGMWKGDKRDGFGQYQWPNNATYRGYWKDDQIVDMEVNTTSDTQEQPLILK